MGVQGEREGRRKGAGEGRKAEGEGRKGGGRREKGERGREKGEKEGGRKEGEEEGRKGEGRKGGGRREKGTPLYPLPPPAPPPLKDGGGILVRELSIHCNEMYNRGHIPDSLKQGVIITQGGRKSKKDPANYRAITPTSSILKVFERLILLMLENNLERPFNSLQCGFRPMTGCNMSS